MGLYGGVMGSVGWVWVPMGPCGLPVGLSVSLYVLMCRYGVPMGSYGVPMGSLCPYMSLWGFHGVSMGSLMCLCVPMGSVWGRCGICVGSLWGRYVPTAAPVAMAALPPPPLLAAAVAARPPPAALRLPSAGLGAAPPAAPPAGREDPRGIEPLRVGGGALWGWEDQRDRAACREAGGPMGGPTG